MPTFNSKTNWARAQARRDCRPSVSQCRLSGHYESVSAGAIIIIAIAATGLLMMRFRERWLAKINIVFTNRITSLFAGWLPGFRHPKARGSQVR